ncbi:MAG: AI-2E family transporter [Propionibacteriaceae bacterium]
MALPAGAEAAETTAAAPVPEVATTSTAAFDNAVPKGVQVAASWAWRLILIVIMVWGIAWALRYLSEVVIPLAIASLLAALIAPVTHQLHKWGLPRAVAALISVFGGLILIAGALTLIGTQIASQASDLSGNVVTGFNTIIDYLKNSRLPINPDWFQLDQWGTRIQDFLVSSQSTITSYAAEISAQVGHFLAGFAITLFALFYFLYDGRGIWTFLLKFFPRNARSRVDAAARQGWTSLAHYVRATILVALSDAVGVLIVALILGVPLAPALAALVFIGAFVPLIGAFVSGFVAVIVALVALGWIKALIMLAGIIVVMQIEGHLLQPFLLGRAVKLHPLAVLIGIAVGIIVGGIVGALMSIPLLAFSKSFIQDLTRMHEDVLPTGELKL